MSEQDEKAQNIVFDNRRDSYKGFFDHDWAAAVFDTAKGTKLYREVFSLCTDWKGISNAFRMPWLALNMLGGYHDGFNSAHRPSVGRLAIAFREYILNRPEAELTHTKRKQLAKVIDDLNKRLEVLDDVVLPFDADAMWAEFITHSEFVLSLRSSVKVSFASIYFAYEEFLRSSLAVGAQTADYRLPRFGKFKQDLDQYLWATAGDDLVGHSKVNLARLIRHALAHNGGRVTQELAAETHQLTIGDDGEIRLMAPDVHALYELLKGKVALLLERTKALPLFKG